MGYKIHPPIKEKRKTAIKIFRGGADDSMCPICLEDFEPSEINTNETIRCESCFQHFHYDCIKHWCDSSNEFLSIQNSVCPICRRSNICRNSNFVRRETEAARIRRGIRDNQMQTPSEISDIILSIGTEYRIRDDIGLTDLMYLDENWKFNRLNSENENERNENMTNWVSDHLDKFINDMNNSAPNPESQWDIADNREENARIFREEVQRATFNRDLPVWFIAPRPEDSLDIQHLRDLHQLKMFTYNEYNRLKRDYPVYSYLELLFSAEKRKINNERRVAKRKLIRISLRIFLYTMILVKKDTVSRGLTVDPVDMVEDSSESESETETETISTQTQTHTESETGSQTQEDTPVPEPDDGEVAEPQEGEENVVENDTRFDWIPVEENPVEASAVEEAPMARNEAERPRARGWRLPRVQPPGVRVTREPDGTVLWRWRLPRFQPQEEDTPAESTETPVDIVGGAGYGFTHSLHKLLTNQEYSNIISYTFDNDGNILIVLKDKFLVAKEVCPRANWGDFSSCARQFCNYGFKTVSRKKIQRIGENELVFSNPKVKSIDDILTLERKLPQSCRQRVNSPTIDDAGANVLMQPSYRSTDMDNNEAANVLASIANISDENTEDLDRRTTYLQNLNTNIEDSIKISLLIEALKQHVVDENEKKQIKQKQNELWQSLKEIPMEDEQRRGVLFKYMGDYLTRTISLSKLKEGAKIVNKKYDSIKRAQIHNRPTEPLTESEQKQADEEMNASIARGQQLAQDEDTNMKDVQSPNTPFVGGAGDLPDDRKELKEMCAKAGLPYNSKEPIERIKKRLTAPRGAAYGGFINSLHELLTNQKYSNIISWENDNDGNFLIVLKDNLLVAKELCPKANSEEGKKKTRYLSRSVQAMKDQFRSYDFNRISNRGENELVFSNPKVKSIDDILTLRGQQSRANQAARRRTRRKARLAVDEQGEPTNRPPRRAASTRLRYVESSSEEESADMAAMAVPRHVLLEHDEQGDLHSVGEESADMADMAAPRHVLLELDEQGDLHSVGEESADVDNNEAANILASITNINDENTEDLDRRTSYLQNLNTNNEHSLKIALLIESLKNHVIDENEKNQIKQKQNELWQGLKEIPMEDEQRRGVLYKYMFEYLKRTIPQAKLNEGAKIAQSNFESIKRAKIHNRPTEPLTESEQKQADEEMNAAISRGQILAQDEDTNMEDVQSPNTQLEEPWWKKSGITDKALLRLHSEPVDGHMIEVWSLDHWKLGRAVRKKGRSRVVLKAPLNSPSSRVAETVRQIVTQVDYIDGTSVDELLHRGDWKQRQNPDYGIKDSENYLLNLGSDNPKYWRYAKSRRSAKSNSGSQSGGVIYVDDENDKMRFECPLSLDIMEDPVIAEDGYSYEKEEIVNWIKLSEDKGNPITSPITGDNMGKTLIPNTVLKDIIENSVFDRNKNQESSQIQDENKNKGIVIQYKDTRFGFIHTFDGIDNLFFHSSQLDNQIIVGDIVSFVIKEYKGKPTATNIKLIEPAWNRKTGVIVKYNNDKQYGFIKSNINGMPEVFVHISEINQLVSVGDKVSFIIGKNMAGKAVAKKVKIINDEIGVEEEKKEDSEIPQLEQRLLMELIFERDRIMREREKVNSMIKSRK